MKVVMFILAWVIGSIITAGVCMVDDIDAIFKSDEMFAFLLTWPLILTVFIGLSIGCGFKNLIYFITDSLISIWRKR